MTSEQVHGSDTCPEKETVDSFSFIPASASQPGTGLGRTIYLSDGACCCSYFLVLFHPMGLDWQFISNRSTVFAPGWFRMFPGRYKAIPYFDISSLPQILRDFYSQMLCVYEYVPGEWFSVLPRLTREGGSKVLLWKAVRRPHHTVYNALHENECDVEVERRLCDFFLPGNLITLHRLGLSITLVHLRTMRGVEQEGGAGSLKYMLVQFPCMHEMTVLWLPWMFRDDQILRTESHNPVGMRKGWCQGEDWTWGRWRAEVIWLAVPWWHSDC